MRSHRDGGFTLIELMVALTIVAVLIGFALPRYQKTIEQARVNFAAGRLVCLATAQRLYHAENGSFASSFAPLVTASLLTSSLTSDSSTYTFIIEAASQTAFQMTATRKSPAPWSGTLTIDQNGTVAGNVTDGSAILEPCMN